MEYNTLKKQKDHTFKKEVYLLGKDSDGIKYWLEKGSWDCDWYWGFGYIETYQGNKKPYLAKDIDSHQHADKFYDKWILGDKSILVETTFTEKEAWKLAELFSTFYQLREQAELVGRGGMNLSSIKPLTKELKDKKQLENINNKLIPLVMSEIIKILEPKEQ